MTFKGRLLMPHFVVRRVAAILPMSQKTSLTLGGGGRKSANPHLCKASSLLYPTTIAARIAASFRVSAMAALSPQGRVAQLIVLVRGPTRSFDLDQTGIAKSRGSLKLPWCCSQIADTGAHNVIGNHEHSAITGGLRGGRTRCVDISEFCQPMFAGDRPRAGQV